MPEIIYRQKFKEYETLAATRLSTAAVNVANDVVGAAQGAAPHFRGQLEKNISKEVKATFGGVEVIIDSTAKGENGFDYAPYIHDGNYFLGEKSRAKTGGQSGMTGLTYAVGKGYLSKPVTMGEAAYIRHFENILGGVRV